jgi:hypothetical protein
LSLTAESLNALMLLVVAILFLFGSKGSVWAIATLPAGRFGKGIFIGWKEYVAKNIER